ncbi:hypothetical protein OA85_15640 [Flavobacterium sp. AED]|nr:hypothetical protein OA85_15640 [Flavobacterium sp. AED]
MSFYVFKKGFLIKDLDSKCTHTKRNSINKENKIYQLGIFNPDEKKQFYIFNKKLCSPCYSWHSFYRNLV